METLNLTLKRKWFDMILAGEKREEYREIKPYWNVRLGKHYDQVLFRNGYNPESPTVLVELKEVLRGLGIVKWGAPERKMVYILKIGKIIFNKPQSKQADASRKG